MNTILEDIPALLAWLGTVEGTALSFHRGRAQVGQLTYGALVDNVARAAATLTRLGVRAGDRVAIGAPNCLELPVWLLAAWRLGAAAVPLDPQAPSGDWRFILDDAGVRGLVAAPELVDVVPAAKLGFVRSLAEGYGDHLSQPLPQPTGAREAAAVILYTSGTMGLPRGVTLSQRNLLSNASAMALRFGLQRATQVAVLPLYHAHALGFGLMTSLVTRGHLVFTDRFEPKTWRELVHGHAATWASLTPSLLPSLLATRLRRTEVPSLRGLLVSSVPLTTELARRFEEESAVPLAHGWGLSEYTSFACCTDPFASDEARRALLWEGDAPSVGTPLSGTEVSVRGEWGERRTEGERGELCVRGPCRMQSYFRDAGATARALYGDWLRTGDQGYFRTVAGSQVFYVSGRMKEMVIRGGETHSPVAVQNRIVAELPEVCGRLVVLGFPHALQGEELGAYVEIDRMPDALPQRLLDAVDKLPHAARPKVILHGPQPIPRTHSGKVQRQLLVPLFAAFHDVTGRTRVQRVQGRARVALRRVSRQKVVGDRRRHQLLRIQRREGVVGAAKVGAREVAQPPERAHLPGEAAVDVLDPGIVLAGHEERVDAGLGDEPQARRDVAHAVAYAGDVAAPSPDASHVGQRHADGASDGGVGAPQPRQPARPAERVDVVTRARVRVDELDVVHAEAPRVDEDGAGDARIAQRRLEREIAARRQPAKDEAGDAGGARDGVHRRLHLGEAVRRIGLVLLGAGRGAAVADARQIDAEHVEAERRPAPRQPHVEAVRPDAVHGAGRQQHDRRPLARHQR